MTVAYLSRENDQHLVRVTALGGRFWCANSCVGEGDDGKVNFLARALLATAVKGSRYHRF